MAANKRKKYKHSEFLDNIIKENDESKLLVHINDERFDKDYKSSRYMIQRMLSMNNKTQKFIIQYQHILDKLDNENHYRLLFKIIPLVKYIRYIK